MRAQPQEMIHPDALKVWRITGAIVAGVFLLIAAGLFVLTFTTGFPMWLTLIFFGLSLIFTYVFVRWVPDIRWRRWRYEVREDEIDLQYGIWWIHRTLVPMVRVQHVDTAQGPILRRFGLATVMVSTAGGMHEIPALLMADADALRDRIAALARVEENDNGNK